MKHVVLPLLKDSYEISNLFCGLQHHYVQDNFFLIDRSNEETTSIKSVHSDIVSSFQIGSLADWYDVIGNVQASFLHEEYGFQLDAIIDAGGSDTAWQILQNIQKAGKTIGLTVLIRIIFFGDIRSPHFQQEQSFYNEIKRSINGMNGQDDPVNWYTAYILLAQNQAQRDIRRKILPYLLASDCGTSLHEVRTCGCIIRELDIHSIESVPKELAVKTVCALLIRNELIQPMSILLMGRGAPVPKEKQDQLIQLQQGMNNSIAIPLPSAMDLLVQKGSPDAEVSTNELVSHFYQDNPLYNPKLYEHTDYSTLEQQPWIVEAENAWEEFVVAKACETGGIPRIIDLLRPDSEFDRLLNSFQKRSSLASPKMMTRKEGYSEEAVAKLENIATALGTYIMDTIFEARIRLIRARMPALRKRLERIHQSREQASAKALRQIGNAGVASMVESWSRQISSQLSREADKLSLPSEKENPEEWVAKQADYLCARIPNPDYEAGRAELAQSGIEIKESIQNEPIQKMIPNGLDGAVDVSLPTKWIVYYQIQMPDVFIKSNEPVIIRLEEWYMDLWRYNLMDSQLFQRELSTPIIQETPLENSEAEETESIQEEIRMLRKPEELPNYEGTIKWIWRRMECTSAKIEIYADTGKGFITPNYTCNVQYRSDDRYSVGGLEKLPSGVPLLIKITYQEKGRDLKNDGDEIRMKAPKTRLEVEIREVKEGSFLKKRSYFRLMIRPRGAFSPEHIATASTSGCVYSAKWEECEGGWQSELLPFGEYWQVVDRPGDLIEYNIIQ